jgi:HSP20 family protein
MAGTFTPVLRDFVTLRDAMDKLFEQSFVDPARFGGFAGGPTSLPLEVYQTPEAVVVKALAPGIAPDNLDITFERGVLTLHGSMPAPKVEQNWRWYVREIGYGEFTRAISLPIEVDAEHAQATFEHGVLTLTLPKAQTAKPRQIRIAPTGGQAQIGNGAQGAQPSQAVESGQPEYGQQPEYGEYGSTNGEGNWSGATSSESTPERELVGAGA